MKRIFAGVLLLLVAAIGIADARFPRGSRAPVVAVASGFNGSKVQTNPNFILQGGDYPFLNAMKGAQHWGFVANQGAVVTPDYLDTDGYLTGTTTADSASGVATVTFVPSQAQRPGAWIQKWDGNGTADISGTAFAYSLTGVSQSGTIQTVTVSVSPTILRANQPIAISGFSVGTWGGFNNTWKILDVNLGTNSFRIDTGTTYTGTATLTSATATFVTGTTVANGGALGAGRFATTPTTTDGGSNGYTLNIRITSVGTSGSDYPHNMRVVHKDDEATLDAGGTFTSLFKTTAGKYGVVRFLNWLNINFSNVSTWNTRKPLTYFNYADDERRSNIYAGATTISGTTYSVSAPSIDSSTGAAWSSLHDKSTISAKISQGQASATATFAGGGSQNVTMSMTLRVGNTVVFSGTGTAPSGFSFGSIYTVASVVTPGSVYTFGVAASSTGSGTITANKQWGEDSATFTSSSTVTINGSYSVGDRVWFTSGGGVMPSNMSLNTIYFIKSVVSAGVSYTLSATSGGSTITANCSTPCTGSTNSSIQTQLNVGGTGAKPVYSQYNSRSTFSNLYPISGTYQSLGTFVYDAQLDAYIMFGGSQAYNSVGIGNGAPIEVLLTLCTEVGAHPWFTMPALAQTPMTDYVPSLMKYIKDNGPSWMIGRYEPPNELWQTNGGVFVTGYANSIATSYAAGSGSWAVDDYNNWYGKALSTLGQAAQVVYGAGNLGTTYHVLGGVQTGIAVLGDLANAASRFDATSYVAAGTVQSPLAGAWGTITFTAVPAAVTAGTKYVSHIAVANYLSSNARAPSSGTQTSASLTATFGGAMFRADSISGGTVTNITSVINGPLTTGHTIFIPGGTTANPTEITATVTNVASYPASITISNSSVSIPFTQSYQAALTAGLSASTAFADSIADTVVNATISGTNLTINSITSGNTIGDSLQIYGGSGGSAIPFATGININSGTYPNYVISSNPGNVYNQTGSLSIGQTYSGTGNKYLFALWANWVKANFGVAKISAYEGGYSDDYLNGGNSAYDILVGRSKQASSLQAFTTSIYDNFRGIGATTVYTSGITGEFPSVFNMTGVYPPTDAWSIMNDIYVSPDPPQWAAVKAY